MKDLQNLIKDHELVRTTMFGDKHTGELLAERDLPKIYDICEIVKPKNTLELGFNRGSSALMWLLCSSTNLVSTDIKEKPKSVKYLKDRFGDRFNFICMNHELLATKDEYINQFDFIFIDGGHSYKDVERDIKNCLRFNPKYIGFDDYYHPAHTKDIHSLIKKYNLNVIKEYKTGGGQALVKL